MKLWEDQKEIWKKKPSKKTNPQGNVTTIWYPCACPEAFLQGECMHWNPSEVCIYTKGEQHENSTYVRYRTTPLNHTNIIYLYSLKEEKGKKKKWNWKSTFSQRVTMKRKYQGFFLFVSPCQSLIYLVWYTRKISRGF